MTRPPRHTDDETLMTTPSHATSGASPSTPPRRRLHELLQRAGLPQGAASTDVPIDLITDDSRKVTPGACFVAVRGTRVDGHAYIDTAVRNGAAAIVVDRPLPDIPGPAVVRVTHTGEALARLAAAYYGLRNASGMHLIGVTGTNGKSTVSWMLRSILRHAGRRPALLGTIEYDLLSHRLPAPLTTPAPLTLCEHLASARRAGADAAVLEISSHALAQRRCDGLQLSAAVFTNLSGDHLDYHGDMNAYLNAKRRIFHLLAPDGHAIINVDDPHGRAIAEALNRRPITFGLQTSQADVSATIRSMTRTGSEIAMRGRSFDFSTVVWDRLSSRSLRLSLIGRHNVLNALAAAATAEAMELEPDDIRSGLERLPGVPGRLQRVEPQGCPFSVVVDYAHTDAALENVLNALRPLTAARLICVFGCGGDRDRAKRPRMATVVARLADAAFVTSDNPRSEDPMAIIRDILPGFDPTAAPRVTVEPDRRRAIESAIAAARPGDCILIAGKGHEDYQLVGDEVRHFDDAEVARDCLDPMYAKSPTAPYEEPIG